MPKSRKDRNKNIAVEAKLHIYCEGDCTERNYIEGYLSDNYKNHQLVRFILYPKIAQNTPESIIKRIIKDKQDHLDIDNHWAVYDRESEANISNQRHHNARELAQNNNINIAFSNICIEQWLLYHFTDSQAAYTSCDNLLEQSKLKEYFKTVGIKKYDKAAELYDAISDKVSIARQRAIKNNRLAIESANDNIDETMPYLLNPYTNFNQLLDAIDLFLKAHQFKQDLAELNSLYQTISNDLTNNQIDSQNEIQIKVWRQIKQLYERYFVPNNQASEYWQQKLEKAYQSYIQNIAAIEELYWQNVYQLKQ